MQVSDNKGQCGMTLVELMFSVSILLLAVAGSTSTAILFIKIATDHENRSDFSSDIRVGMERVSFDVRNARQITGRTDDGFTLINQNGIAVSYQFSPETGLVTRTSGSATGNIFSNVSTFDVLQNDADAPVGMPFSDDEIAIERLEFTASNGTSRPTSRVITEFTLVGRNL